MKTIDSAIAKEPRPRGFAALTQERRNEIASMGGKAAHKKGTAHEFTTEEAIAAGKLRRKTKIASSDLPIFSGDQEH